MILFVKIGLCVKVGKLGSMAVLVSFAGLALTGPVYADQVEQATVSPTPQEVVAQTDHQVAPQAELAPSTTKEVPQVVEPSPSLVSESAQTAQENPTQLSLTSQRKYKHRLARLRK